MKVRAVYITPDLDEKKMLADVQPGTFVHYHHKYEESCNESCYEHNE